MHDKTEANEDIDLKHMLAKMSRTVRTGTIDPKETALLVRQAMGPRSQRKFADLVGLNVSSISRIANGQTKEIRPTTLAQIAFYADPDSGVTLEALMRAQGLEDIKDRNMTLKQFEEDCRRIIVDELLKRGFHVEYETIENMRKYREIGDFALMTDAVGKKCSLWIFECIMLPTATAMRHFIKWFNALATFYYLGGTADKASIVVSGKEIYEHIKLYLEDLKLPDRLSVLLIDLEAGRIIEEYNAPLKEEKEARHVFDEA